MNISQLQKARYAYSPKLPDVFSSALENLLPRQMLQNNLNADDPDIKTLFPHTYLNPPLSFSTADTGTAAAARLRVAAVLSGGQAAGGHNVIAGLYDSLKKLHPESRLFGFLNGPQGLLSAKYIEITDSLVDAYRNTGGFDMLGSGRTKIETPEQMAAASETVQDMRLDAVVIIGGDDSNTNAAMLAEYFLNTGTPTSVIGVPKTIDGDLKSDLIETSFGFDTASKVYANLIGNIQRDAVSAKKYWHFIKLMGRHASHLTLECALRTQPNITLIAEEIAAKNMTLKDIVNGIAVIIAARAAKGEQFGVILIPEGIIEFIPEMKPFIAELNAALAAHQEAFKTLQSFSEQSEWIRRTLSSASASLFASLPEKVAEGFLRDRDEHGNLIVSMIKTEQLIISLVQDRLSQMKKEGAYTGKFAVQSYFFGYEGRAEFPSNFDADYCYTLGYTASLLAVHKKTGYIASVLNLHEAPQHWKPCGVPLAQLMTIEVRSGSKKPVIKKSIVDLTGVPFATFAAHRYQWASETCYTYPGPIQYFGPSELCDTITETLSLEKSENKGK